MRKAFILILFLPFLALSQPTITDAVVPGAGDESTFRLYDATTTNPGDSGQSVTWDFSNLAFDGSAIFSYLLPSELPNSASYPAANLGLEQDIATQVYLETDAQHLSIIGTEVQGVIEEYNDDPKELLRFPISYGDVFNDSLVGSITAVSVNADRTGEIEISGNAFGTLILPYATFQNVLRVRTVTRYEDRFLGNVVNTGTDTVYTWYANGVKDYLFTWNHFNSTQFGSIYYGAYLDTLYVGLEENQNALGELRLFPNPTSDVLNLEIPDEELNTEIRIFNSLGKLVYTDQIRNQNNIQLHLENFDEGSYFIILRSGNREWKEQFMVQRN